MTDSKKKIAYKTGKKRMIPETRYVEVERGFTQVYDALTEIMPRLSFSSNGDLFLIWICVRAGTDFKKGVRIAKDVVADFNNYLMEYGRKKVSKTTVHRYVAELTEQGVLWQVARGYYQFNVNYLWRGTKELRDNLLRLSDADRRRLPMSIEDAEEVKIIAEFKDNGKDNGDTK